jgi:hypothetical protein
MLIPGKGERGEETRNEGELAESFRELGGSSINAV